MELLREEKNKKVFVENYKLYHMLNMGSYVGHRNRSWYASKPAVWILMATDEKCEDGEILHMEALVDDRGDYTRFILQKGEIKRVLQLQNGRVYSDTINDTRNGADPIGLGQTYVAMNGDIYSDEQIPLNEYLSYEPEFSLNGETFDGEVPSNSVIEDFLTRNNQIRTSLNTSRR